MPGHPVHRRILCTCIADSIHARHRYSNGNRRFSSACVVVAVVPFASVGRRCLSASILSFSLAIARQRTPFCEVIIVLAVANNWMSNEQYFSRPCPALYSQSNVLYVLDKLLLQWFCAKNDWFWLTFNAPRAKIGGTSNHRSISIIRAKSDWMRLCNSRSKYYCIAGREPVRRTVNAEIKEKVE